MKIVVFNDKRLGAFMEDGSVIDLNLAYTSLLASRGVKRSYAHALSEVPPDLLAFIEEGETGLKTANEAVEHVREGTEIGPKGERLIFEPDEVEIQAPLPSLATRIMMAGANFYDHAADVRRMFTGEEVTREDIRRQVEAGEYLAWGFWKQARNVIDPGAPIVYPDRTERLDYEVEVAAIFGEEAKDVEPEEAMDHIYGYTIVLDMSLRDQPGDRGLFLSKNFDTSVPMGPCLVTADEIGDPHKLGLRLKVNGELRQEGTQEDMIRGYPFWISMLTRDMTFYPGDMICGGTCSGTALDTSPRDPEGKTEPDNFLQPGDIIEASVEKIGTIRHTVVAKG
ncbi:MAG: fumarylacetoacetate hydrolase family protein [Candidatus Bathyarchaeota archaeon]|jgi:acylpyruvate hydrolase